MINQNIVSPSKKIGQLKDNDILLEKIPDHIYNNMINIFADKYHFKNGEQMRISNYFVKISRSLSDNFVQFIDEVTNQLNDNKYPKIPTPNGFKPHSENLLNEELNNGFSLGSFDMAVSNNGLENIEFQSVATYPISAAKLNQHLLDNLNLENAFIFADNPKTNWDDFIEMYNTLITGNQKDGIVLVDRKIKEQKTNFEFFATQKELKNPIEIVDMEDIYEDKETLFYKNNSEKNPVKINRFYNRILLAEALFEDNYPENNNKWKFRFDKKYKSLKFVNHPIKQFDVSKRLSPFINHPCNPGCFQLSEVVDDFKKGNLKYEDYVWKHKWGAAGHKLILEPNKEILESLSDFWEDYIAQKKVNFKIFKTDDNQEKIVELRFMTAIQNKKTIIVPMARIGQAVKNEKGDTIFKIHFSDNNKEGYGFSPVIIFDDKK
ncbi:hypothetical protein PG913_10195 [Tenacibaculum pacificus]|uniref:hypothetical protein n=1 Tax=Tenacibaculum pacificus TaxID=3018314 RepID=UPI0022F3B6EA|nr:hypothetical protein [Tenacibaculum pacificus]WBX73225.1 hypothetical protein PG913_10195 [Tenacibaculum pacificus]